MVGQETAGGNCNSVTGCSYPDNGNIYVPVVTNPQCSSDKDCDKPDYKIDIQFLNNGKVWAHAKNIDALHQLLKHESVNCFWHQEDDYTITSKGVIWAYPGKETSGNSVCVMPENVNFNCSFKSKWVCTDFVKWFEEKQKDGK